jgi:hypothetical protein
VWYSTITKAARKKLEKQLESAWHFRNTKV